MKQFPDESNTKDAGDLSVLNEERYLIRQRNAHAWAEVFMGGAGWITFEAIPNSEIGILSEGAVAGEGEDQPDEKEKPKQIVEDEKPGIGKVVFDKVVSVICSVPPNIIMITGFMIGFLLLAGAFFLRIPREQYLSFLEKIGLKKKIITRIEFYNEYLLMLEKQGIRIALHETPLEFASRLSECGISVKDARFMAKQYYRLRYGRKDLTDSYRVMKILEITRGQEKG
jgi:hypothetical protein